MLNPNKLLSELTYNKHFTVGGKKQRKKQMFYSIATARYVQILFSSPGDKHHHR